MNATTTRETPRLLYVLRRQDARYGVYAVTATDARSAVALPCRTLRGAERKLRNLARGYGMRVERVENGELRAWMEG
ncbi:MAG TPA: hypothetical protein PKN52_00070 [Trueperaceae bacterium]|nr:hypothetical protein [Trueperaceae bacterium]